MKISTDHLQKLNSVYEFINQDTNNQTSIFAFALLGIRDAIVGIVTEITTTEEKLPDTPETQKLQRMFKERGKDLTKLSRTSTADIKFMDSQGVENGITIPGAINVFTVPDEIKEAFLNELIHITDDLKIKEKILNILATLINNPKNTEKIIENLLTTLNEGLSGSEVTEEIRKKILAKVNEIIGNPDIAIEIRKKISIFLIKNNFYSN